MRMAVGATRMAVVMVAVMIVMAAAVVGVVSLADIYVAACFFDAADAHADVFAADAALYDVPRLKYDARKPRGVHFLDERGGLIVYVKQRGRQHIARRAHIQFKVECFHLYDSILFIMLAA